MPNYPPLLMHALAIAKTDERIRAVVLNGSRVNPAVMPDAFQDIDLAMYVRDFPTYPCDFARFTAYGEVLITQTKAEQVFDPDDFEGDIALIQFASGERLDISFWPIETLETSVINDSLSKILIDKDHRIDTQAEPSEVSYHVKKPTEAMFQSCVKQFYFLTLYVAKGVYRHQWAYAIDHLRLMRHGLEAQIDWSLIAKQSLSTGKHHAKYPVLLDSGDYAAYLKTFPTASKASVTLALNQLLELFAAYAMRVAKQQHYAYNRRNYARVETAAKRWMHKGPPVR